MTGVHFHVVTQRQNLFEERVHQLLSRTARQICSADGAGKQAIADKNFSFRRLKQHYVSGSMSGTMNHLKT